MNELSRTTVMDLGAPIALRGVSAAPARVEAVTVRNSRRVAMTTSANTEDRTQGKRDVMRGPGVVSRRRAARYVSLLRPPRLPTVTTAVVRLCLLFFLSGASGLIYQVVWVREFGNVFGNTLYSAS